MNRNLLVTLLTKNIDELRLIAEGFEDSTSYSIALIQLAKRKTEDIQLILDELGQTKPQPQVENIPVSEVKTVEESIQNSTPEVVVPQIPEEVIVNVEVEKAPIVLSETITETILEQVTETIQITDEQFEVIVDAVKNDESSEDFAPQIFEQTIVVEETKKSEETRKITIADKMSQQGSSRNDALSQKDKSLSATIANKKIDDIKQAISIGDRFRFQRELFKSNGEDMNKTLTYINQLATFGEVDAFLKSKYNWSDDVEAVNDFMQIVHRKFS